MIVGLTGGIGSGKSEVTQRFRALGIRVIDADEVARYVVEPDSTALQKISAHFGKDILTATGTLDRAHLRQTIFANPAEKNWLENLLHPIIREEIVQRLQQENSSYVILASPLLLETTQHTLVDRVLVVDASEELQLARASLRDHNNPDQIKTIMRSQMSRSERCNKADDIIHNHGDLSELDAQVKKLHLYFSTLSQQMVKHD